MRGLVASWRRPGPDDRVFLRHEGARMRQGGGVPLRVDGVLAPDRLVREGLKPLAHVDAGRGDQLDHQDADELLPGVDPVGRAVGSTPRIAAERAVRTGHPEVCDDGEAEPEADPGPRGRSEEHTSELQSPCNLVCRLLLEKKKNTCRNSADGKACMEECSQ